MQARVDRALGDAEDRGDLSPLELAQIVQTEHLTVLSRQTVQRTVQIEALVDILLVLPDRIQKPLLFLRREKTHAGRMTFSLFGIAKNVDADGEQPCLKALVGVVGVEMLQSAHPCILEQIVRVIEIAAELDAEFGQTTQIPRNILVEIGQRLTPHVSRLFGQQPLHFIIQLSKSFSSLYQYIFSIQYYFADRSHKRSAVILYILLPIDI